MYRRSSGQCGPVTSDQAHGLVQVVLGAVEVDEQGRVVDEATLAVDEVGELAHGAQVVLAPCPIDVALHPGTVLHGKVLDNLFDLGSLVEEVERVPRRVVGDALAIGASRCGHHDVAVGAGPASLAGDNVEAGAEALYVPLPRAGDRFVEVVDVEDKVAFGAGEEPEVVDVGVAAGLDGNVRRRCGGQVHGHDGGGAPKEGEG